jgi:hypothetical protein
MEAAEAPVDLAVRLTLTSRRARTHLDGRFIAGGGADPMSTVASAARFAAMNPVVTIAVDSREREPGGRNDSHHR